MTSPQHWGKHFWYTLHITALAYPSNPMVEEKQAYKDFFQNFGKILPCIKCKGHYDSHLAELPLEGALTDSTSLFNWTVDLHNIVNRYAKRPAWTYEQAFKHYMNGEYDTAQGVDPLASPMHRLNLLVVILNLIVVGYLLYLWKTSR